MTAISLVTVQPGLKVVKYDIYLFTWYGKIVINKSSQFK